MASKYGDIQGIKWLYEDPSGSGLALVQIAFTMPAFTATTDTGSLGGNSSAGSLHGAANDTLETILQNDRRDGKVVDIFPDSTATALALNAGAGLQAGARAYVSTIAESSGNLTFQLANATGVATSFAAGVSDAPIQIVLSVTLT